MAKKSDLTGQRFGRLVVSGKTGGAKHGSPIWACVCDCGSATEVVASSLKRGFTRSCGCFRREAASTPKAHDLVGQRFERLLVLERVGHMHGNQAAWRCRCDCGSETMAATGALNFGHKRSCGCLNPEAVSEARALDLTGRRFGRLVALERTGTNRHGAAIWLCKCDCGNFNKAPAGTLNAGYLISCGCASRDQPGLRPDRVRKMWAAHGQTRRARLVDAGGTFTADQVEELWRKQRGRCASCRTKLGDDFHRDHRTALVNGGDNDITNIELLCPPCNLRKGDKDEIAWANEIGRLI